MKLRVESGMNVKSVNIISGEDEGAYMWVSLNYKTKVLLSYHINVYFISLLSRFFLMCSKLEIFLYRRQLTIYWELWGKGLNIQ